MPLNENEQVIITYADSGYYIELQEQLNNVNLSSTAQAKLDESVVKSSVGILKHIIDSEYTTGHCARFESGNYKAMYQLLQGAEDRDNISKQNLAIINEALPSITKKQFLHEVIKENIVIKKFGNGNFTKALETLRGMDEFKREMKNISLDHIMPVAVIPKT